MSMKRLFFKLFLLSTALTLATVFALIIFMSRMDDSLATMFDAMKAVRAAERVQIQLYKMSRENLLEYSTYNKPGVSKAKRELREAIEKLRPYIVSKEERNILHHLSEAAREYEETSTDLLNKNVPPVHTEPVLKPSLTEVYRMAERLAMMKLEQAKTVGEASHQDIKGAAIVAGFIGLLSFIGVLVTWFVVRQLYEAPIRKLANQIRSVSGIWWQGGFPKQGAAEIQAIATAFEDLLNKLNHQRNEGLKFISSVAHDLRNPLSAIQMSVQLLLEQKHLSRADQEIIEIISRQVSHLDRMVGDFLDAGRIESGRLEFKKSNEDLRVIVEQSVRLHQSVSDKHEIHFEAPNFPVVCECDSLRIGQVLNNLISNAIKYSPNGGRIAVKVSAEPRFCRLTVEDQGIGINEKDLDKIFEPFSRSGLGDSDIPGLGLGLSVTKKIIEAHHGQIDVKSRPGEGSEFIVKLPKKQSFDSLSPAVV